MNLEALHEECRQAVRKPHGHVNYAPILARCGGPGLCRHCLLEQIAPLVEKMVRADCVLHLIDRDEITADTARKAAHAVIGNQR